jgi:hypothetical protein
MIKMSAMNPKTNREMLVIGLSEGNLMRLREGKPIVIHAEEWGQKFDLMVFWGETEQAMVKMVKPFLGPETVVRDELTNRPKKN